MGKLEVSFVSFSKQKWMNMGDDKFGKFMEFPVFLNV